MNLSTSFSPPGYIAPLYVSGVVVSRLSTAVLSSKGPKLMFTPCPSSAKWPWYGVPPTLILLLHSYMKHRCPGSNRPGLIHSNSRMDAIVVQGQGPLEGGGLSGGVTASFLFELGGPSFDGQPVGGGFTACVPLDGGGVTASPSFRSPLSSTLLFINFLPNLLEGLVETCIPATALAAMGEKGLHSSAHRQFGGPFRASSSVLPNEFFAFIRSKLGQRVCDPL